MSASPIRKRTLQPAWRQGFSLIEVTLAIGIVSFALLAVVALLPTGLKAIKNASEQSGAGATLTAVATALRHAARDESAGATTSTYTGSFAGQDFTYTLGGGAPGPIEWSNLTLEGTEDAVARRLVARLEILQTPSADGLTPGRATVSVAWSAMSNPTFDTASKKWQNAEGSMVMPVQFLPSARP